MWVAWLASLRGPRLSGSAGLFGREVWALIGAFSMDACSQNLDGARAQWEYDIRVSVAAQRY